MVKTSESLAIHALGDLCTESYLGHLKRLFSGISEQYQLRTWDVIKPSQHVCIVVNLYCSTRMTDNNNCPLPAKSKLFILNFLTNSAELT